MPRYDGTGPQGQGPMTGRGEGHCAIRISRSGQASQGYAGIQGKPVSLASPSAQPGPGTHFRWLQAATWLGRAFGRGRDRGAGRGSGRRSGRW